MMNNKYQIYYGGFFVCVCEEDDLFGHTFHPHTRQHHPKVLRNVIIF